MVTNLAPVETQTESKTDSTQHSVVLGDGIADGFGLIEQGSAEQATENSPHGEP